jgi:hypothetical protein
MPGKLGAAGGGLGSRRAGHRFVVVVYGDPEADEGAWPGHVVHIVASLEAEPEVRAPFEHVDRLPELLRELIKNRPAQARSAG